MNTILITGGAGFIGSNFVNHILEKREELQIIVLDSLTYAGNLANLSSHLDDSNIIVPESHERLEPISYDLSGNSSVLSDTSRDLERLKFKLNSFAYNQTPVNELRQFVEDAVARNRLALVVGSIEDRNVVEQLVPLCDTVVNFAAETHVDRSILNPDQFIKTDVYGTYVLLEASRKNPDLKRFLHVSTDEVYGVASERSFSEKDPINPRNPYSASKAAADRLVYAYNQTYGLPVNIVRPSNNFGPNQYPEKLIPVMIIKALRDGKLPVYGDGKQVRDWLFVRDTARAIELILERAPIGEVYNIAGRNERENLFMVKTILERLGKSTELINYVKDRPGHDVKYSLDDSKLRNELGYSPEKDFESNLKETIDWYVNNQEWWQKILDHDKEYREFMNRWYRER
ncbi:dTDP-glucose 4,6-dehydratase [Mesotoga sp. UBA5825]|uniref:dTDP-glucose 4,6-dehydratase n=1 Tax=Mesotoga sp. UBA5825 TaxID=1946858 RepID=UPI0025F153A1|nr:dTDP-glucose 4,6-dehydratase [Mesotoga sp. UBA5825]